MTYPKVKMLAPNQFVIHDEGRDIFQSYESIIAVVYYDTQNVYLDKKYWDYSKTTSKYRNIFLGEDTKTTQAKIDSGEYKLLDLN